MKFESFRPKSTEDLGKQANKAQENLGEKLTPSESSFEEIDISTIQEKYKTRYDAYLSALRAERKGDLDVKEIHHAKMWIKALNNLDSYIKDHESKDDPLLREKQFLVYKKIRDFLEQGKRAGYVKLPAGSGKTILFSKIAEALDMKTVIASPTRVILNQNADETRKFTDSEYGKYYGSEKDLSKKVTHITYDSLVNTVKDGKLNPDDVHVLILDEAHRSLGPERTFVVNKFNDLKLGFTATAEFSDDKKVSNLLEDEIYSMEVNEAIQEGMICQTQTIHAYTNVDLSSVPVSGGEYNKDQLEKVINVHGRNIAALELYKNKFSHLKAFVNCSGVKHAEDIAKLFNENGISAACITGDTPPGDEEGQRGWILNKYKEGEIRVLTNARVLLEGFDESTCAVTFNLNPTLSLVDAEQRARSGRLDKNNPDKWSYVVDFIDKNSAKPQVLYSEILKGDRVSVESNNTDKDTNKDINNEKTISDPRPPVNFDGISVDGLRVVVDTQMIMEITKRNLESREENENIPNRKEGWLGIIFLSKLLKVANETSRKEVEKYRNDHPEWFEIQKGGSGVPAEHYAPELVEILKKEFEKNINAISKKEGWDGAASLSKLLKSDRQTISKEAEKYRNDHPEWFEIQKSNNGQLSEYYDPKLIEILKVVFEKINSPLEEGWKSFSYLSKIFSIKTDTISRKADKYRNDQPEWFQKKIFINDSGNKNVAELLSPELVEILKKEFEKNINTPLKKEGWEGASSLSSLFKSDRQTISKEAEKYRKDHSEWFEIQKGGSGAPSEYYAPEFVEILKKEFEKNINTPLKKEGWENKTFLAKLINTHYFTIEKEVEKYRNDHPEWFEMQKTNNSSQKSEYYAPEFVEILKKEFEKNINTPLKKEGWESAASLYKLFNYDIRNTKVRVEKYRNKHPEWFEIQRIRNNFPECYSPELIEQIKKDLEK